MKEYLEELAEKLSALTPEQMKEFNTLSDGHNLRVLPIRIKPDTGGGCVTNGCPKGYYCDAQSGNCILSAGG